MSKTDFNIVPIAGTNNRVIIEPEQAQGVTNSGIIIPNSAQEKPQSGIVRAISEMDMEGRIPELNVGERVIYGKYVGTEIDYNGKEYLIVREHDIYAVFR